MKGKKQRRKGHGGAASSPSARKRSDAEVALLGALDLLRQRRAPYADLLREIVNETLERFPPLPNLPIAEVGAGAGQLRDWPNDPQ